MPDEAVRLFRTIRPARASHDIVQQIKSHIFDGTLVSGDRLPSEKELAEQFGLSRITVRDALRVLESQGLISIKVGSGGGAFIANPATQSANELVTDLLRLQRATSKELVEARTVIETSLVTFAAERATPEDLAAMQEAINSARAARSSGHTRFTTFSVDFHIALAKAAKNLVLQFTVDSFRTLFYETLEKLMPNDLMALRAIEDHQAILNAITAHDAATAREIMRHHLSYFEEHTQKIENPKEE